MQLFSRNPTCHERGVCQRTAPQCRRVCHMADAEPPIGYEAARASNVHQLRPTPVNRDEALDHPDTEWEQIGSLWGKAGAAVLVLLAILAAIGWTLHTDYSALLSAWQMLQQLGWAAMHVTS